MKIKTKFEAQCAVKADQVEQTRNFLILQNCTIQIEGLILPPRKNSLKLNEKYKRQYTFDEQNQPNKLWKYANLEQLIQNWIWSPVCSWRLHIWSENIIKIWNFDLNQTTCKIIQNQQIDRTVNQTKPIKLKPSV